MVDRYMRLMKQASIIAWTSEFGQFYGSLNEDTVFYIDFSFSQGLALVHIYVHMAQGNKKKKEKIPVSSSQALSRFSSHWLFNLLQGRHSI